jgi:small redox-active disulfide protein 2
MRTIAILGTGCPRCQAMADNAEAAARELGIECQLLRVTEVETILDYDVLMTPALAVDGEVKVVGIVPSVEQIKELLR